MLNCLYRQSIKLSYLTLLVLNLCPRDNHCCLVPQRQISTTLVLQLSGMRKQQWQEESGFETNAAYFMQKQMTFHMSSKFRQIQSGNTLLYNKALFLSQQHLLLLFKNLFWKSILKIYFGNIYLQSGSEGGGGPFASCIICLGFG